MKYKQKLLKLLNRAAMYESTNPQFNFKQFLIHNTLILAGLQKLVEKIIYQTWHLTNPTQTVSRFEDLQMALFTKDE